VASFAVAECIELFHSGQRRVFTLWIPLRKTLNAAVTKPAWQSKPSWYLVATDDRMILPPAQRSMARRAGSSVVESQGSHAVYVSQPEAVAALIKKAARSVASK